MSPTRRQAGQGLVEYALIIALVAIVVIAALVLLSGNITNAFSTVNNAIGGTPGPVPTATP